MIHKVRKISLRIGTCHFFNYEKRKLTKIYLHDFIDDKSFIIPIPDKSNYLVNHV